MHTYQQALHIFTRIGHRQGQAAELSNIGNIHFNQNKLNQALSSFQDALYIFKLIDHPRGQADCLGNIGLVQYEQGLADKALDNLRQARTICAKIGARSTGYEQIEKAINEIESAGQKR